MKFDINIRLGIGKNNMWGAQFFGDSLMQVSLDPHCSSVAAVGFGKRAAYSAKDSQIARFLFLRSVIEGAKHQRMTVTCADGFLGVARTLRHPRRSTWYQSNALVKPVWLVPLSPPWVPWLMSYGKIHPRKLPGQEPSWQKPGLGRSRGLVQNPWKCHATSADINFSKIRPELVYMMSSMT